MSAGTAVVSLSIPRRKGWPARRNVRSRSDWRVSLTTSVGVGIVKRQRSFESDARGAYKSGSQTTLCLACGLEQTATTLLFCYKAPALRMYWPLQWTFSRTREKRIDYSAPGADCFSQLYGTQLSARAGKSRLYHETLILLVHCDGAGTPSRRRGGQALVRSRSRCCDD